MTMLAPPWPERLEGVRIEPLRPPVFSIDQVAETNGYRAIEEFFAHSSEPALSYDLKEEVRRYLEAGGHPAAVTNRFGDDLVAVLDPFVIALETSVAQPEYRALMHIENDPHVATAMKLARCMPAYVDILAHRNQVKQALHVTDLLAAWGENVTHGNSFMEHLLGVIVTRFANDCRMILAEKQRLSPSIFRRWIRELEEQPQRMQPPAETMRYELVWVEYILTNHLYKTYDLRRLHGLGSHAPWYEKLLAQCSFLVGSTEANSLRHVRNFYSHKIGRLENPSLGDPDAFAQTFVEAQSQPWIFFDDPLGKILVQMVPHGVHQIIEKPVSQRGVRLCLAARLYEQEAGKAPGRLEDLVPTCIESIPADPYDPAGGPFLYRDGIIYSRYQNQIDDHALHAYEKQMKPDEDFCFPVDLYRHRLKHFQSGRSAE